MEKYEKEAWNCQEGFCAGIIDYFLRFGLPFTCMYDHFCMLPSICCFQYGHTKSKSKIPNSPSNTTVFLLHPNIRSFQNKIPHLVGGPPAGPSGRLPGPLLGDAVDIVASPSGRVRVLLPKVNDLERLLTGGRAGRLRLIQTLLRLHFGVKRGVLPGQLGQVRLRRHLGGRDEGWIKGEDVELERRTRGKGWRWQIGVLRADWHTKYTLTHTQAWAHDVCSICLSATTCLKVQ